MSTRPNGRVVVTGMGAVSPLGIGVAATWQGFAEGRSGIRQITLFDTRRVRVKIAGEVPNFQPEASMPRKQARHLDRYSQLAVVAALEARDDANLQIDAGNTDRVGVMVGTGIGGIMTIQEQIAVLYERGPDRLSPFVVPMMLPNMASGQVSIFLQARGPNLAVTTACASGTDSIGIAADTLRRGDADVMIVGGAEAPVCELGIAGFHAARALSTQNDDPPKASRPFDAERDGFVMGEGAGILILERAEDALRRGARIWAEIAGYQNVGDAYHMTQPAEDAGGGGRAMAGALAHAGIAPNEVDYINAHGTSTPINDRLETVAIKRVFGEAAYTIPISSTKSMIGHLMGASGAVEAIACIKAINEGLIPPTINLDHPDPDCDLDYVPHRARRAEVRVAMSNSMGFGGHNACLVFKRWEP